MLPRLSSKAAVQSQFLKILVSPPRDVKNHYVKLAHKLDGQVFFKLLLQIRNLQAIVVLQTCDLFIGTEPEDQINTLFFRCWMYRVAICKLHLGRREKLGIPLAFDFHNQHLAPSERLDGGCYVASVATSKLVFNHIHEPQGLKARSQPVHDALRCGILAKPLSFLVELVDHPKITAKDLVL